MDHIRAWRRSGDATSEASGSPGSALSASGPGVHSSRRLSRARALSPASPAALGEGGGLGPARLTEIYSQKSHLDFGERFEDGFRDLGTSGGAGGREVVPATDPTAPTPSSSSSSVVILVDRREDDVLAEFTDRLSKKLLRASDHVTRVMVAALLVSETLGRSGYHASNVQARLERLVRERVDAKSGVVRLGDIMHDLAAPGGGRGRQPGAGTARHRALLFKSVADWLGLVPCALCRDAASSGATWNVVLVEGEPFVLDVMFDPGALYSQGSGKADEYLRRLRQESKEPPPAPGAAAPVVAAAAAAPSARARNQPSGAAMSAAPSMQQNLGGRMLRPSWHVEPWEIEFDRRDRAGRGGFGEVFQGAWAGQVTAVKEVRDANPTDGDVCDFILEISLLSRLSHPNVIRFWRGCVDLRGGHRTLLLVTEWMDRGVLSSLLHESNEPNITPGQMQVLALGTGMGVAYLHQVKILHLDLKSPNVLLNSSWQPKLCDFGLAKLREQTALHTTLRGVSPIWAPPEMFDDKAAGLTEKADVYSFGIIIFELATRKLPFSDVSHMQLPRAKAKGQLPRFPEDIDPDMQELSKICLAHRPANRPSMQVVIEKIRQMAKTKGIDLQEEQIQMERRGLHFGGPGGSTPNAEQLRRAEAEKKRAELEVGRLRKLLQEEEARVRALEEQALQRGLAAGGDAAAAEAERQRRIDEMCASLAQAVGETKFRCALCRKLFRGPEFVHKHVREKHLEELLSNSSLGGAAAAGGGPGHGGGAPDGERTASRRPPGGAGAGAGAAAAGADRFFDADVAEESDARVYTNRITREAAGGAGGAAAGAGNRFSQVLQDAAEAGDLSKVQQCLLQGGTTLNQADIDGTTPLHLSAKGGHVECVQYMLSNSADVRSANESGLTPLHLAAQEGQGLACELLLQAGAPLDADTGPKGRSPLHLSAANGHREVCGMLLMSKSSVNMQDVDGESPLHNAARCGDRELCEVILSFGAHVCVADNDGWSPLHEAARWGDGDLVESLLQRGADIAARSNDGESALHVVPGGFAELQVVQVLLAWRCDVNCKDYDGESPLHVAVKLGDAELAGVLLSSGADPNAANLAGATPLDLAKKDEIRWLLRSYKARKGTGAP